MVRSMASHPIVFALANPTPEISYEDAMASRPDVLWVMIETVGHELDYAVFAPALGKGVAPDVGGFE